MKLDSDPGKVGNYSSLPYYAVELLKEVEVDSWNRSYWEKTYPYSNQVLIDVGKALQILATQGDINDLGIELLMDYVKAHNAYRKTDFEQSEAASKAIAEGWDAVEKMSDFWTVTPRTMKLHWAYFVALHGQSSVENFNSVYMDKYLSDALKLMNFQSKNANKLWGPTAAGNGMNDAIRLIEFTTWQSNPPDNIKTFYTSNLDDILSSLKAIGSTRMVVWKDAWGKFHNFLLHNILNSLNRIGSIHKTADGQEALDAIRPKLDNTIIEIYKAHNLTKNNAVYPESYIRGASILLSSVYVQVIDGNTDACEKGKLSPYCSVLTADTVLGKYPCPGLSSVVMRIQLGDETTDTQKQALCDRLKTQTDYFKSKMSVSQPVEDDLNETIEMAIFSNRDEYRLHAPIFGYTSNSGGMYLEGEPDKEGNQPRFYAYFKDVNGKRDVWNFEHEFVHYLDGRFNTYGRYGHYPENRTVWWAEGIAEFMAHKECFSRGLPVVADAASKNQVPSLHSIINVDYSAYGTDAGDNLIYTWTYSLHRYLHERGYSNIWYNYAKSLRTKDRDAAMSGIETHVSTILSYATDYESWIKGTLAPWWEDNKSRCELEGRTLGHQHHHGFGDQYQHAKPEHFADKEKDIPFAVPDFSN